MSKNTDFIPEDYVSIILNKFRRDISNISEKVNQLIADDKITPGKRATVVVNGIRFSLFGAVGYALLIPEDIYGTSFFNGNHEVTYADVAMINSELQDTISLENIRKLILDFTPNDKFLTCVALECKRVFLDMPLNWPKETLIASVAIALTISTIVGAEEPACKRWLSGRADTLKGEFAVPVFYDESDSKGMLIYNSLEGKPDINHIEDLPFTRLNGMLTLLRALRHIASLPILEAFETFPFINPDNIASDVRSAADSLRLWAAASAPMSMITSQLNWTYKNVGLRR